MQVQEITSYLETIAPLHYQENYDNSGLIIGNPHQEVTGIITCLDSTEKIIEEAIAKQCNLVIAHHPIIFSGLKKITGKNYIERTIIKAIRHNIAIYAIHTNLDNVLHQGVNQKIAQKIGLENSQILAPVANQLSKLIVFTPKTHQQEVRQALFNAGGGHINNYDQCSFNTSGTGTFRPLEHANPFVGNINEQHQEQEVKIEIIFPNYLQAKLISALTQAHPYEEIAYDIIPLKNTHTQVGAGIIGTLPQPIDTITFLQNLKTTMNTACVRHTQPHKPQIQKIAVCGGSGSFLLHHAIARQADLFLTADFKYHQFFDADIQITIADIGHYETEQFTIELLHDELKNKFPSVPCVKTSLNTNPVHYL